MLMVFKAGAVRTSIAVFLAACVATTYAADPTLDSATGAIVKTYLEVFNSQDTAKVRAFEEKYRTAESLAKRSMEDRLKQYQELSGRLQRLTLKKVLSADGKTISTLIEAGNGAAFRFVFEFENGDSPKLISIMIEGPLQNPEAAATTLDKEMRAAIIDELATALRERYVFPETGEKMANAIRENAAKGKYDDQSSASAFALMLTEDLQAISKDKHLRVRPTQFAKGAPPPKEDDVIPARENYGFRKVEVLPGNVGYIKFDIFNPSEEAKRVAASALAFVANCDALVFDLRENGGGSPEMIKFITSYLLDKPTLLNRFLDRTGAVVEESYTSADVPGKRFAADLPVYVLTSHYTFSGAEEFSYNLKNLQRGTIVGETTGGGAHPVSPAMLADTLMVTIPFRRAQNPISKTNWEGVGVKPDIECASSDALDVALRDARKKQAHAGGSPE